MTIQSQVKEIYDSLQDELSVSIFENRILYSLTQNSKYIDNILESIYGAGGKWNFLADYSNIVIYGAGLMGSYYQPYYAKADIVAFCDKNKARQKELFCGYKVISPEELEKHYSDSTIAIAIQDDKLIKEVTESLLKSGFAENKILVFKNELIKSMGIQYFDPDIIRPKDDEVFIDAGCFDGASSIEFIKWCNEKYKKIIAFEPNPAQYLECVEKSKTVRDMEVHPYGLWNGAFELSFANDDNPGKAHVIHDLKDTTVKIKTVALDEILNGEKATFIKMDIEGSELNALKGAERTILKYRPKLAICIYHKPEDIWEIPYYILSLHKDYKLYIRHYSVWGSETVLYAV